MRHPVFVFLTQKTATPIDTCQWDAAFRTASELATSMKASGHNKLYYTSFHWRTQLLSNAARWLISLFHLVFVFLGWPLSTFLTDVRAIWKVFQTRETLHSSHYLSPHSKSSNCRHPSCRTYEHSESASVNSSSVFHTEESGVQSLTGINYKAQNYNLLILKPVRDLFLSEN